MNNIENTRIAAVYDGWPESSIYLKHKSQFTPFIAAKVGGVRVCPHDLNFASILS